MKKKVIIGVIIVIILVLIWVVMYGYQTIKTTDKQTLAVTSLKIADSVTRLLPVSQNDKDAVHIANELAQTVLVKDGVERNYLLLLQNNYELRPGGGFLGQYAIVTVKDGEVVGQPFFEDANLLDKRQTVKVTPPFPSLFKSKLSSSTWRFRDSNFSADFPTNVEKAEYFYRLSGGWKKFDAVIAVNADVLNEILKITGPITPTGYSHTFTSEDAAIELEEIVEKAYLGDEVPASAKEQRKNIMKVMAREIVEQAVTINNIPKLIDFAREQLENKNVMLYFKDEEIQKLVADIGWDGAVETEWDGDYLMLVDANMGALKSDFYMKRRVKYEVDLTAEVPTATVTYTYNHTAPIGDWRTSDWHGLLRIYTPNGSEYGGSELIRFYSAYEEFNKTAFSMWVDAIMNHETHTKFSYTLPERIREMENYKLLIQKQSGVGELPVHVIVYTTDGAYEVEEVIHHDTQFEFQTTQEEREE